MLHQMVASLVFRELGCVLFCVYVEASLEAPELASRVLGFTESLATMGSRVLLCHVQRHKQNAECCLSELWQRGHNKILGAHALFPRGPQPSRWANGGYLTSRGPYLLSHRDPQV